MRGLGHPGHAHWTRVQEKDVPGGHPDTDTPPLGGVRDVRRPLVSDVPRVKIAPRVHLGLGALSHNHSCPS
jgi:hypothetical protein